MYPWSGNKQGKKNNETHPEPDASDVSEVLRQFRESAHASAEKPAFFWKRQHNEIMMQLNSPAAAPKHRELLWAPAALAILLCLFLFVGTSKAPTPDLAAGSDQILLIEIERALSQDCPDALAPAGVLHDEMEKLGKAQ